MWGPNPRPYKQEGRAALTRSQVRIQKIIEVAPSTDSLDGRGAASVP